MSDSIPGTDQTQKVSRLAAGVPEFEDLVGKLSAIVPPQSAPMWAARALAKVDPRILQAEDSAKLALLIRPAAERALVVARVDVARLRVQTAIVLFAASEPARLAPPSGILLPGEGTPAPAPRGLAEKLITEAEEELEGGNLDAAKQKSTDALREATKAEKKSDESWLVEAIKRLPVPLLFIVVLVYLIISMGEKLGTDPRLFALVVALIAVGITISVLLYAITWPARREATEAALHWTSLTSQQDVTTLQVCFMTPVKSNVLKRVVKYHFGVQTRLNTWYDLEVLRKRYPRVEGGEVQAGSCMNKAAT